MKYLLDTHTFIWVMERSRRIPKEIEGKISDPRNHVVVSVATVWEIIIKRMKKPLEMPKDILGGINQAGFVLLPIEIAHVLEVEKLPLLHKDPFDRMLISQAKVENLTLITADPKIWEYKIPLIKVQS